MAWFDMYNSFQATHSYPDGLPMLAQPSLALEVFSVIDSQIQKERDADGKRR